MKPPRYIERDQIKARFFLMYFLYSRVKYGTKGSDMHRLGKMSAYKAMMLIYKDYTLSGERILSVHVEYTLQALCKKAQRMVPKGEFQEMFIQTVETFLESPENVGIL
ncbi:MAG: hypothetical protein U9N52_11750 [Campylobacterota bacterium]|nr:hypothetical protein [Campylobacterota bacterium]